jgi:hypothetical protein
MKKIALLLSLIFFNATICLFGGTEMQQPIQPQPGPTPATDENKNSTELFEYESVYTGRSDFERNPINPFGHGDSFYNDFSYAHRFLITGNWYFRAGAEYERFDFGGSDNGLPDHLQTFHALLALEYIVHDHAGAGLEIEPGPYFQDHITGDSVDVPWKIFATIPLKKDKIFGVIGLGGSIYSNPSLAPGGGLIWLFTDKLRLEGVFPKPALVYNLNDDWEFRVAGDLVFESFRTDDVITGEKKLQVHNAVVQYTEERVGLVVDYGHFKHIDLILDGGCNIKRDFDFFRAEASAKTHPAPYVRFAFEAKF